ncbi:MAG: hypothetical protein NTV51_16995 [Verrucomicrobia bacterium]|nr:hypothetical protein [Verrucomicrobiota bacterium]
MSLPNFTPPPPPPASPPPPDPGAIAAAVIDVGKGLLEAGGHAVGELAKNAGQVNEHTTEAIKAIGDGMKTAADRTQTLVNDLFKDLMTNANNFYSHLPTAPLPPPLSPTDVLTAIATAISQAENVLNQGAPGGKAGDSRPSNLVIATGTVDVEFNLRTPAGEMGATTRIHLDIAPKPYN